MTISNSRAGAGIYFKIILYKFDKIMMIKREYKPRAPLYSRPMQSHAVKSMRVYPANIQGEPIHRYSR